MKTFFTFLYRNKLYTFINLLGLSVSLMFVILITSYVVRSFTKDSNVEKADRIYTLATESFIGTGYWNGQHLKNRYPEIEEACGITHRGAITVYVNDTEYSAQTLYADTTFFEMFSISLLEGDAKNALIPKENAVISRSFANKVFGQENPIGKTLAFENNDNGKSGFVVAGIMPDIENSVFPKADIVTNFLNVGSYNPSITDEQMSNAGATTLFLLEKEGADLRSKTEDILEFFKTYFWIYQRGACNKVEFIPFKDIYFSEISSESLHRGDFSFVLILSSVGLLILIFSIVNYINLTVSQTEFRAKEMAARRLLGSSRAALFGKLIAESLFMCLAASLIGFSLAISAEPFARDLLQSDISILEDMNGTYLASYVGLVLFVSLLSGIVPAWIISNFKPIEVVRGSLRRKSSMVYGKILIVFQNTITIVLIGSSICMNRQLNHLIDAPMGYEYENVIDISTWSGFKNYGQIKAAVDELKQLPFVEEVGQGLGTPLHGGNNIMIPYGEDKMISFRTFISDSAFYDILGLKIKRDNKLTDKGAVYFNEYAFKEMQLDENVPVIKMGTDFDDEYKVAGIFHDFRIGTALNDPTACIIRFINFEKVNSDSENYYPWDILVKVSGNADPAEAHNRIKDIVKNVTGSDEIEMDHMADMIEMRYADQKRTADIVFIFTIIAVIISSLGLLAMSTYFIQQRRKEIAIRKVFGSTQREVLKRIIGTFMAMVGISFVLSVPVIWYLMEWWLADYPYRISLSPVIFLSAGVFSGLTAFITIYWQSRTAARENPVKALMR